MTYLHGDKPEIQQNYKFFKTCKMSRISQHIFIYLSFERLLAIIVKSHDFKSFTVTIMTWLIATKYLCHKWPGIMFHLYHNPVLLSYQIFYKSNMSSATNGARTAYPSGAPLVLVGLVLLNFIWPCLCLLELLLQLLIIKKYNPLASSNFSDLFKQCP